MSFLKKIFSKEQQQRQVSKVQDLHVGDMIILTDSFALPENLRNQQFQVSAVNSYEYQNHTDTEWVLTGKDDSELYLSLEVDDKTYLKFALKVQHQDVESLFDLDEFATIFDEPGQAFLDRKTDSQLSQGWSAKQYQQSLFAKVGYFHRKDHRSETLSVYEGKDAGEQFELYQLLSEDQSRGIELEVWQDGETDVFLTLYRPTHDIVDMFPGS
ncbi:hypothetical protein tinsulaeT_29020 [Thalassotalea insulae]|uniref:DUF4178 domain-containing protein n=1 Tax=Thalassotalea insulae TaxID=2056778 RepID=A0ABQ6GY91_9GAMM|nr:hypothetical protein [Thalassotalea insulae]GLX79562.1 hypothetical protein tinsulaeT_29020 [Thalassotalea insulae]